MDDSSLSLTPRRTDGGPCHNTDTVGVPKTPPFAVDSREISDSPVHASLDDCPTLRPPSPSIFSSENPAAVDAGSASAAARLSALSSTLPSSSSPAATAAEAATAKAAVAETTTGVTTTTPPRFPTGQVQFRSHTIAPSPPLSRSPPATSPLPASDPDLEADDPFNNRSTRTARAGGHHSSLRLQTDIQSNHSSPALSTPRQNPDPVASSVSPSPGIITTPVSSYIRPSTLVLQHKSSSTSLRPISRTPSLKTTGYHGFGSASAASSTVPSPIISAMGDVTPLPSPLLSGDSPGPWKKLGRSPPNEAPIHLVAGMPESAFVTSNGESLTAALAHHAKRKAYAELLAGNPGRPPEISHARSDLQPSHTRERSLSEYAPDPMQSPKRMVTVSATHSKQDAGRQNAEASYEPHMRREPHLSEARGLTPVEKPPTPPPSESSMLLSDGTAASEREQAHGQSRPEYFEARGRDDQKRRRWRSIKLLGQGTFSRVMLATNQISSPSESATQGAQGPVISDPSPRLRYDRSTLVAIKICEHGPKGGASEDRIEMSLKRELEIMRCIHHPSLVRLKAWNIEPTRAILVLSYCPGGDLFDVASAHRDVLSPPLLARMFSELVSAVQYLHGQHIVHRDIKLENVLVNLTPAELADNTIDWATYPYSVTTLTDLGLSRRVADDEKLETRCGSDDYAAPEVIMGQPYDGRATDAWSLGVLLYALLEGRLPFDPNPGMSDAHRMRSRTSHRIARVEWRWIRFAGDDGDHEGDISKFQASGLGGAMEITEGLLKRARSRLTLDQVAETAWVHDAVAIKGGLQFREEAEGEEII